MEKLKRIKIGWKRVRSYVYKHRNAKDIVRIDNNSTRGMLKKMRRIALFVHYSKEGPVSYSDWKYLEKISTISDVLIISNSPLAENEKSRILLSGWQVMERRNVGYDFGAWKEAILNFREVIEQYDEISLINNSCFFPVFPLDVVYNKMESCKVDFWGMTAFKENPQIGSVEANYLSMPSIPTHVQSYFLVFNLHNVGDLFFQFWEEYKMQDTFEMTVRYGEVALTEFMVMHGKKYKVYIRETLNDRTYQDSPDLSKSQPDVLLSLGSPLIKKKSLGLITLKQYNVILKYLTKTNRELCQVIESEGYGNLISKEYKILNKVMCCRDSKWHS